MAYILAVDVRIYNDWRHLLQVFDSITKLFPFACAVPYTNAASSPQAQTFNGSYAGVHLPGLQQELYLGIPYAKPPTESLRYRPPRFLDTKWNDTRDAKTLPNACPQYPVSNGIDDLGVSLNEDCLQLNIVKPAGDSEGLPVLVWIHGGSYQNGYSALPQYNMSYLVSELVAMGKPIIGVSINYRLAYFGFLASNEIQNSGNANLGLRDQQLAFEWIQENIEAFGGDPEKVTIWGESAGAMSVGSHLISNGGDNRGLYRAAILESGGATVDAYNGTDYYQPFYDDIVANLGCSAAYDTLDCLRSVPYEDLYAKLSDIGSNVYRFDYMPIIDGDFLREWPHAAMLSGRSANVPIMTGHVTDEGSAFCPTDLNATEELHEYLLYNGQYKMKNATVNRLLELYPDTPSLGSPFNDVNVTTYSGFGQQFKRIAAMLGDYLLMAPNRFNAETSVAQGRDVWAYRFNVQLESYPAAYGVPHGSDIPFVFGIPTFEYTEDMNSTSRLMTRSWVAFTHDLDPNGVDLEGVPEWPRYNEGPRNMLFGESVELEDDTYREEGIRFINEHLLEFVA